MFIGSSAMVHFYNFIPTRNPRFPVFRRLQVFSSSTIPHWRTQSRLAKTPHPKYQNEKMKCADAVSQSGVKRVFLSLMALNEIAIHDQETCVDDNLQTTINLINSIKQKNPDAEVVILSNTYMVYNFNSYPKLNNGNISALNNKMLEYCNQNGIDFIDLSTFLMDGNVLADKYCKDAAREGDNKGCHLTNEAYALWTATLRNYACLKLNNAWTNPASMPTPKTLISFLKG